MKLKEGPLDPTIYFKGIFTLRISNEDKISVLPMLVDWMNSQKEMDT